MKTDKETQVRHDPPALPEEAAEAAAEEANRWARRFQYGGLSALVVYGLLLPEDWAERFGPLAWPMRWAAENVPGVVKVAASSSTPAYMAGLLGLAVWLPPLAALAVLCFRLLRPAPENMLYMAGGAGAGAGSASLIRSGAPTVLDRAIPVFLLCPVFLYALYTLPFVEAGETFRAFLENDHAKGPPIVGRLALVAVGATTLTAMLLATLLTAQALVVYDVLSGRKRMLLPGEKALARLACGILALVMGGLCCFHGFLLPKLG